jgi:hypothetical protein
MEPLRFEVRIDLPPELLAQIRNSGGQVRVTPHVAPHVVPDVGPEPVARTAPVRYAPRVAAGGIQDHFYSLMRQGALLQQQDVRLGDRGLLIPDGGLCATTSAVNVLHAAFSHLGRDTRIFASTSDALVGRLVNQAWQRLGKDARMGLDFSSLQLVINEVANQIDPHNVGVKADRSYSWRRAGGVNFAELRGDEDTLALLCVTTGPEKAHAITVLDIDEGRRTISYSDPNYPNQEITRRYWINGNGELQLDGFPGFGVLTDVLKIRTKNFDWRGPDQWGTFANQRAWITSSDGRRFLTSIDRVDDPSPEYPSGRVVHYSSILGGTVGGTWTFDDIRSIEESKPPTTEELQALEKHVGETVRIRFVEGHHQEQYGEEPFRVKAVARERTSTEYPYGGLEVEAIDAFGRGGLIPFDSIASIEVVDERLAARATGSSSAIGRRRPTV